MRRRGRLAGPMGLAAFFLVMGCGGEPELKPSGPPIGSSRPAADRGENRAPVIARLAFTPPRPRAGEHVQAVVSVVDADGDPFRLSYRWSVGGEPIPGAGQSISVPNSARRGERVDVEIVASDGRADSDPARLSARIGNRKPLLSGVRLEPVDGLVVGTDVEALPEARDPDEDSLEYRYAWFVNGRPAIGSGDRFATDSLKRDDRVHVRVVATDGDEQSEPFTSQALEIGNSPPEVVSRPGGLGADGAFRYTLETRDADNDRNIRFRLLEGPSGMRVDPVLGRVEWTPQVDQAGAHDVEVAVDDGHGGVTGHRFLLTVNVKEEEASPANAAP